MAFSDEVGARHGNMACRERQVLTWHGPAWLVPAWHVPAWHVPASRLILLALGLAAWLAVASVSWATEVGKAAAGRARPNVVVVLVDDMGVMDTSLPFLCDAAGKAVRYPLNDYYRTPNMERLAALGTRFSDFSAMSVCSPTRVSLMTGQNPARHHTTNWINPDNDNRGPNGPRDWNWRGLRRGDVTLAALLRSAGYRTIHVGKGHFGPRGSEGSDPKNLGFDINVGGASIGQPGSYYARDGFGAARRGKAAAATHAVPHLEAYHGGEVFLTEALTMEAKRHVADAVREGRPFFLNFAHYAVHAPFQADPRFVDNYKGSGKPAAAQAFASLVEGMDKSLGDLLNHLESLGVSEDTLVLFLGDNGSDAPLGKPHEVACAAPLRGKKGSHYEGGTRAPLIAAWAKANPENRWQRRTPIIAGAVQQQPANITDLFPTVLAAAELEVPSGHIVDGHPLQPLLASPKGTRPAVPFVMHYPHAPHRSDYFTVYRDGDWKLVYHYFPSSQSEGQSCQLFNLASDPFESTNRADQEVDRVRALVGDMTALLDRLGGQFPVEADGRTPRRPRSAH